VKIVPPKLETLPETQRLIWPRLSEIGPDFVLYGGTAISLQVGGRRSVDFDFFSAKPLAYDQLASRFSFLKAAKVLHRADNTATFLVGNEGDGVSISFFGSLGFGRVDEPVQFVDNGLYAAGLLDLAAQKVVVIQQRAEAKDYLDIHTLLSVGISLEMAMGAARALYPEFNAAISLKALSYFKDVPRLPPNVQRELGTAASRVRDMAQVLKQNESLLPEFEIGERSVEGYEASGPPLKDRSKEPELEI